MFSSKRFDEVERLTLEHVIIFKENKTVVKPVNNKPFQSPAFFETACMEMESQAYHQALLQH